MKDFSGPLLSSFHKLEKTILLSVILTIEIGALRSFQEDLNHVYFIQVKVRMV